MAGARPGKPFGRWRGATVVCIASGPSLTSDDCEAVRAWRSAGQGRKVIVVNTSFRLAPWADVLYACDGKWWGAYGAEVAAAAAAAAGGAPASERWTADPAAAARHGLSWVEAIEGQGLCKRPGRLFTGGNSGYQAVGLAWQWGAARVVLLGFDMQMDGTRCHWHADHPAAIGNEGRYASWAVRYAELARDLLAERVEVVNASRQTALACFRRVDLGAALGGGRSPAVDPIPAPAGPLLVHGMHGMGDNLHQRAVVRRLMERHQVWLETPWPAVYHDLVGERLRLINRGSTLRTQAKNAAREASRFTRGQPPTGTPALSVSYPPQMVRDHGSVLAAMSAQCAVPVGDFRLPIPAAWAEKADAMIAAWKPSRPILIYRPLVERSEWGGCVARNPDFGAYAALIESISDRFFVVSVADLVPGREWMAGQRLRADVELHAGELDFEALAALTARAALAFCAPGFLVILAQAVGTAVCAVFGGYERGKSFSAGAAHARYLPIEPIRPCECFSHHHGCDKRIDLMRAERELKEFIDASYSTDRPPADAPPRLNQGLAAPL